MTQLEPLQVTMDEAVVLTRISRRTLDEMITRGRLASNKIGRRRYIPMSEIRRLTLATVGGSEHPMASAVAGSVAGAASDSREENQQNQHVIT